MTPKIFFFGTGNFSRNYIEVIEKKFAHKIKVSCIITDRLDYQSYLNTEKNLNTAIEKYGVPSGFIICTSPNKNLDILTKILKFNKPIIIEKPICLPKELDNLIFLLGTKNRNNIIVNHFYFFHETLKNEISKIKKIRNSELKFIDGSNGPIRNYSPLIDWAPHSLGLICYFQKNIDDLEILLVKKIKKINNYNYNIYLKIFDSYNNNIFKIMTGNNFKKKYRKIRIKSINKSILLNPNDKTQSTPLENILKLFVSKIDNSSENYFVNTKNIALSSIKLINKIEDKINLTKV